MTVYHMHVVFIALGGQTRYKAHLGRQPQAALVSFTLQIMYPGPVFLWFMLQFEIFLQTLQLNKHRQLFLS